MSSIQDRIKGEIMTETKTQGKKEKDLTKIMTPIFIALLVVAAFLGGSLVTQLKFSPGEKKEEEGVQEAQKPSPTTAQKAEAEGEVAVLGVADLASIEDSENVKGDPDAPVTIVEFSEYFCSWCKRYVDETYSRLWEEYGGQIRYILRDFPVHGEPAKKAAQAAYCAGIGENYWSYHDLLFENQAELFQAQDEGTLEEFLKKLAESLDLNEKEFSRCLSSEQFVDLVEENFQLGRKVGIQGTPSFFVNGRLLVGAQPFENFQAVIEEELEKKTIN